MKPSRGQMSEAVRQAFQVGTIRWLWTKGPMYRHCVRKRHALWWALVAAHEVPVDEVARWVDRDKQAVHYGVRTATRVMAEDPTYRAQVHKMADRFYQQRKEVKR